MGARRIRWVGALLVPAALAVGVGASQAASAGPHATRLRAAWRVLQVGPAGRTLTLGYLFGGCRHDDGRATAVVSSRRVRITVRQSETNAPGLVCPLFQAYATTRVRLGRPIDGRRVEGGPRLPSLPLHVGTHVGPGGQPVARVPRVIGLDVRDASDVLADQGFRVRTTGRPRGPVIRQRPAAESRMRLDPVRPRVITIRAGRR